jgi:hypothetical protein
VTMQVIRCSAWFGSVWIGFLAPEIFIRAGSAQWFSFISRVSGAGLVSKKMPNIISA